MAEDDHVGGLAAQVALDLAAQAVRLVEDVRQVEAQAAQGHSRGLARVAQTEAVDVARHRGDGRDGAQLEEHFFAADVAAVEDVIDAREGRVDFLPEEAVGVGDDADAHQHRVAPCGPGGERDTGRGMLLCKSPPGWLPLALERFDEVLVDHAHCEKKAAAHALSLLAAFPEVPGLARAMARLAREEAGHLTQVLALLEKRKLLLGRDRGDPYVKALQALVRTPERERLVDRLLVSALIEVRSEERLRLLGEHLPDLELREFYTKLAKSEEGHGALFLRLARKASPQADLRFAELALHEARIVQELPLRPGIH